MELVAYYRVSTRKQGASGLGLDAQRVAVRAYAARTKSQILAEFTEQESGRVRTRPQLAAALARAELEGAKIVVAKLDRLARDVRLILDLLDGDVPHVYLDYSDADVRTAAGWFQIVVSAVMAEYESRRGSERTRAALARKREREGWTPKRKPAKKGKSKVFTRKHQRRASAQMHAKDRAAAAEFRAGIRPVLAAIYANTRSLIQTAAQANAAHLRTRRGKRWSAGTVWAVLN